MLPILITSPRLGVCQGYRASCEKSRDEKCNCHQRKRVSDQVLDEILPVADAMNIDFGAISTENYYRKLGGDLETVKHLSHVPAADAMWS